MDLSIVIPAHNEQAKIAADVVAAGRFLHERGLSGELLIVDDGSDDGTGDVAAAAPVPADVQRNVIWLRPNRGKGAAVRAGILQSRGDYVLFADAGLCVPFEDALLGLDLLRRGQCDIAHGSRKMHGSVIVRPQPLRRQISSRLFRAAAYAMLPLPEGLTDTQCGFKMYRGDAARRLYTQCRVAGFMFDIEVIVRAMRLGCRIREFPVRWTCDRDSRLRAIPTAIRTWRELREIRRDLEPPPRDARGTP